MSLFCWRGRTSHVHPQMGSSPELADDGSITDAAALCPRVKTTTSTPSMLTNQSTASMLSPVTQSFDDSFTQSESEPIPDLETWLQSGKDEGLSSCALLGDSEGTGCVSDVHDGEIVDGEDLPTLSPNSREAKSIASEKLWRATEAGDLQLLRRILRPDSSTASPAIEARFLHGWTALHLAAHLNHAEIVLALLQAGADSECTSKESSTPLHLASHQGHLEVVKLLFGQGCDMEASTCDGDTAMHLAAAKGHAGVVHYLLQCCLELILVRNNRSQRPSDVALNVQTAELLRDQETSSIQEEGWRDSYAGRTLYQGSLVFNSRLDVIPKLLSQKTRAQSFSDDACSDPSQNSVSISPMSFSGTRSSPVQRAPFATLRAGPAVDVKHADAESFIFNAWVGSGNFSNVCQVVHSRSNTVYAMKIQDKPVGCKGLRYARSERNILTFMRHPFIVQLAYAFQTTSRLMLVLEFCPGGTLLQLIRREGALSESVTRLYTAEVFLALEYLHERDIVFRDLKPANILIDAHGHTRLTDFGLAKQGVGMFSGARSFCGSVSYLAPEVLRQCGYGRAIDLYGLGVILHQMLIGKVPFFDPKRESFFENIRSAELVLPAYVSPAASALIHALMDRTPEQRLGTQETVRAVPLHEFFVSLDFDKVLQKEHVVDPSEDSTSSVTNYLAKKLWSMTQVPSPATPWASKLPASRREVPDWEFTSVDAPIP